MRLIALHCGDIHGNAGALYEGAVNDVKVTVPVMCFAVVHPKGTILWETGMNPLVQTDPVGYWGKAAGSILIPDLPADASVERRLSQAGLDPDQVKIVVNSHLHNDHAGMNRYLPRSTVLVRRREFEHAVAAMDRPSGFIRNDFYGGDEIEPNIELFDYEESHDLVDDGSVRLISTIGHTPGHQSLVVTFRSGRAWALSGDAMYREQSLEDASPPGVIWNRDQAVTSVRRLIELHRAGTDILVQHDPQRWATIPATGILHEEP